MIKLNSSIKISEELLILKKFYQGAIIKGKFIYLVKTLHMVKEIEHQPQSKILLGMNMQEMQRIK
jgi:hypothetical protein